MNIWTKYRSSIFSRKRSVDSSVRAAVDQVIDKKTKVEAYETKGAAILVGSSSSEYFADPATNEEPIIDDDTQQVESDWLS